MKFKIKIENCSRLEIVKQRERDFFLKLNIVQQCLNRGIYKITFALVCSFLVFNLRSFFSIKTHSTKTYKIFISNLF